MTPLAPAQRPIVSVVIPCYNQAHYLTEAVESALGQTYRHVDVVVVDDGSIDNTAVTARRFLDVRCIQHANAGLAAARNTGLAYSRGEYVVFLDADDRLTPHAIESGLQQIESHVDCAFVAGHYRRIAADGSPLEPVEPHRIDRSPYEELLLQNFIMMHATVMYRRAVLEAVGAFNAALRACEDYDLYLRIARLHPIHCYDQIVAEYRWHGANMTGNPAFMLKHALAVLDGQWTAVKDVPRWRQIYASGRQRWRDAYCRQLAAHVQLHIRERRWRQAGNGATDLLRYHPAAAVGLAREYAFLRQFAYLAPRGLSLSR